MVIVIFTAALITQDALVWNISFILRVDDGVLICRFTQQSLKHVAGGGRSVVFVQRMVD